MGLRPEAGTWASGDKKSLLPQEASCRIDSERASLSVPSPGPSLWSDRGSIRHGPPSALACHQGVSSNAVGWTHKTPEAHRHPASPDAGSMFHVKFSSLSCVCSAN